MRLCSNLVALEQPGEHQYALVQRGADCHTCTANCGMAMEDAFGGRQATFQSHFQAWCCVGAGRWRGTVDTSHCQGLREANVER